MSEEKSRQLILVDNLGAGTSSLNALAFCKTLVDSFLEGDQANSIHIASSNADIFQFYKDQEVRCVQLSSSAVETEASEPCFKDSLLNKRVASIK